MDDESRIEELTEALVAAVGLIREKHIVIMGGMAIGDEVERSWKHYIKTDPTMRQIMTALGSKGGK